MGLKYVGARFDSRHFEEFVRDRFTWGERGISWSRLLLPPDLLYDGFTHCGKCITDSPHFRLMAELLAGRLSEQSEYVWLCRRGILDGRLGFELEVADIRATFDRRREELEARHEMAVRVVPSGAWEDKSFVIADGKHRAALAAALGRADALRIEVLDDRVFREPFFRAIYGAALRRKKPDLQVNQRMIRSLLHERETGRDC